MADKVCKKTAALRAAVFFAILEKPQRGCSTPPPSRARVNSPSAFFTVQFLPPSPCLLDQVHVLRPCVQIGGRSEAASRLARAADGQGLLPPRLPLHRLRPAAAPDARAQTRRAAVQMHLPGEFCHERGPVRGGREEEGRYGADMLLGFYVSGEDDSLVKGRRRIYYIARGFFVYRYMIS